MVLYSERIYMEDGCRAGYLEIRDGKFTDFIPGGKRLRADINAGENRVIPGIFDTHNHGGFGVRVNDGCTPKEIRLYVKGLASTGVTAVFPTTYELKAMKLAAAMAEENPDGAAILGIHSEGPWGARVGEKGVNTGYPQVDLKYAADMVQACKGMLKLVAIAPELAGAGEAMAYFLSKGITMAAYHTNAGYDEANLGIDRGITVATHLGNVMTGLHHRDVGMMGACLLRDEVDCELICDGMHVSNPMLRLIFRMKNHDQIMMVSDSVQYAGAPVGAYLRESQTEGSDRNRIFVTEDGFVVSKNGRLSGSSKSVLYGMKNLVECLGMPLEEVIRFSSYNPCRKYGFLDHKGSIKIGKDGDFTVISGSFEPILTFREGREVYNREKNGSIFNQNFLEKYYRKPELAD